MSPQFLAAACRERVSIEAEAKRPILSPVPKWFTTVQVDFDARELQNTFGMTGRKGFAASQSSGARRTACYGYSVTGSAAHPSVKDPRMQVSHVEVPALGTALLDNPSANAFVATALR